jgi:hypothetical protein
VITVGDPAALWVAVAVPVAVVGWAMWFSARAAISGPTWALSHLERMTPLLVIGMVAAFGVAALVRPVWLGVGAAYPLALGAYLAGSRRRQLRMVSGDGGFGEINRALQSRVLTALGRGLGIAGIIAGVMGTVVVTAGLPQGWLVAGLAPVALAIAATATRAARKAPG